MGRRAAAWCLALAFMASALPAWAAGPRVLLVTRTDGFRHENLGPPLRPGLNPPLGEAAAVQRGMLALAAREGWRLDYTEDLGAMARLDGYAAVVFVSTGDLALDASARAALRRHLSRGGGFVGVHYAVTKTYRWPWYAGLLGGARLSGHEPHRAGEVTVVDPADASMRGLPPRFAFRDEWYAFATPPAHVRVLAMGEGRPVAWCARYGGGKAWVTTLGHDPGAFVDDGLPGGEAFRAMLAGAVRSVSGAEPFCR